MSVVGIVVGIDKWSHTTEKFVRSVYEHDFYLPLVVVSNMPPDPYPPFPVGDISKTIYTVKRVGYGQALNSGIHAAGEHDWYVCFNNDNLFEGPIQDYVEGLDPNVLYGSGWNHDPDNDLDLQWSAWMVISKKIWETVGAFNPVYDAAFEDFDYELRAMKAGFPLATAELPVKHLDKRTRFATPDYKKRWREAARAFREEHHLIVQEWL
jgi:hypothetical protein